MLRFIQASYFNSIIRSLAGNMDLIIIVVILIIFVVYDIDTDSQYNYCSYLVSL